jgi:ethanolamine ammonia-lyase small subunit
MLAFQEAHAAARDAVQAPFHGEAIAAALAPLSTILVASQAGDRTTYLRRPDLGRQLDEACATSLPLDDWDLAIVVADGLCAPAAEAHAASVVRTLVGLLPDWGIAPVIVAELARVALGDEIGERLGAAMVLVLIGERPGLSAADSLGAYVTFAPRVGRLDAERNCVSNIRPPHGLTYQAAADTLAWLLIEGRRRRLTGTRLKDERTAMVDPQPSPRVASSATS